MHACIALRKLREIVWVELPSRGVTITQNESFGTMESVKATQDLVAPISGTIIEVNEKLESKPGVLNEDPYGEGWILVVTATNLTAHACMQVSSISHKTEERHMMDGERNGKGFCRL